MKNFILYIFITIILGSCASNKTKKNNSVEAYNYSSMENKTFFNAIFKKSDFDALKITSKHKCHYLYRKRPKSMDEYVIPIF